MKIKKIAACTLSVVAVVGALAAVIYHALTRDPTPIRIDPKLYDDYAGYYDFGNGYVITVHRDGNRLMSDVPGQLSRELFPETESKFFVKGEPLRIIFHRNNTGQVGSVIAQWKKGQERAERIPALPHNPEFTNAIIAATTGGKAAEAGLEILKEGGTAADAAMAIALCEVVHAGGSYVSFAGPLMMMYYDASSGKVFYLDAQYNTPIEEKHAGSIPGKGGRTALVPGFMAGVQAAHDRFGKVTFKRLFDQAIAMAENGELVSPVMEWWINSKKSVLSRLPETKRIFTRADGKFYAKGDLFRQPELAGTLSKVAGQGATYMYEGDWGRKFAEVIQKNGGKITHQDMKNYKAVWEEPLQTTYRDYQVYAPGLSSWGGVNTVEGMNLLELANLKQYGHFTTSARSLLWLMEIAQCDRLTWQWRQFKEHDLSPKSRATKQTSAWIWHRMQSGTWYWQPRAMNNNGGNHTDALVVVDPWGNMAVVNHTINTVLWGNTGIFVDGVSIPDSARFQAGDVALAGPGHRLPIGMSPVIICRGGKPVLGSSTTGGGLHPKHLQVLVNILDFGMDPQTAVDTPAFVGHGWDVEPETFDPKVLDAVKELGVKINVSKDAGMSRGYWVGVQIDPMNHKMKGGVSRGLEGQIAGY